MHSNQQALGHWREDMDPKAEKPVANPCASRLGEKEWVISIIGLEILECADYWELEPASPKKRN